MKLRVIKLLLVIVMTLTAVAVADFDMPRFDSCTEMLVSYKYGQTRLDLLYLERQVAAASKDASLRCEIERKLLDTLTAAQSYEAKAFTCQLLSVIGTAKAVPQLEAMLTDPELSHAARSALARIDAPEAPKALCNALAKTSGKIKAGIINTLAESPCSRAKGEFIKLVNSPDQDVATAAAGALGDFGGTDAEAALRKARAGAKGELKIQIDNALLGCAEKFLADGNKNQAEKIYKEFYSPGYSEQFRVAGLRGLAAVGGEDTARLLVEAIKGDDPAVSRNAIGMMALMKGAKTTEIFVDLLGELGADGQELVVRALAASGDVSAVSAVIDATGSPYANVRMAALEGLGDIGNARVIDVLAKAVADAEDAEKQVAKASLLRVKGKDIDDTFIRKINSTDRAVRIGIINTIGQRNMLKAFGALAKVAANDNDAAVRSEAILSMGRVGQEAELNKLIKLALKPKKASDRTAIEKAIVIIFNKIEDKNAQAGPIIAALRNAPDDAKGVLLLLLARPATDEAFDTVRAALQDTNNEVAGAAIRSLSSWPTVAPADDLYKIASSSTNQTHKVLALRGYIRIAPLADDSTAMYIKALKIADRNEDIKLTLSGMGSADSLIALELTEKYMEQGEFKTEASLAAVQIAGKYCWQDSGKAANVLDKVAAATQNNHIHEEIKKVRNEMERFKGYSFVWEGVGPYLLEGTRNGREVFDTPFGPELGDAKDLKWVKIARVLEGDRINLQTTFGAHLDHCSAYVRTRIFSPARQDAHLSLSGDDFIKGWLNGKVINGDIELRTGYNDLMLKVGDYEGGWAFNCRILKRDGSVVEGLKFDTQ